MTPTPQLAAARPLPAPAAPQVEVVVPVRDEEADVGPSVRRLRAFLDRFPFSARVTIADNGSTDGTWMVASALCRDLAGVRALRLELPGRGRALKAVWSGSDAEVLAYMDVDLSTDLNALLPLVAPLLSGHSDLAIGTRLARGARVVRGPRRELVSRAYNLLLHATLRTRVSDAQCGFKAIRRDAAAVLLPLVEDTAWFFDTELLVLAECCGLRVHEVPVDWVDDLDSRVALAATAWGDLRGIARLGRNLAFRRIALPRPVGRPAPARSGREQAVRFAGVGVASTLAWLMLYLALRPVASAQVANAASLLLTAVANTAANRRVTFGVRGRVGLGRQHARGLVAFGAGLGLTAASLAALHAGAPHPSRLAEVAVLVAGSLGATLLRFVLYREWVFRHPDSVARPALTAPETARSTS